MASPFLHLVILCDVWLFLGWAVRPFVGAVSISLRNGGWQEQDDKQSLKMPTDGCPTFPPFYFKFHQKHFLFFSCHYSSCHNCYDFSVLPIAPSSCYIFHFTYFTLSLFTLFTLAVSSLIFFLYFFLSQSINQSIKHLFVVRIYKLYNLYWSPCYS